MEAAKLVEIIDNAQQVVEFGVRFNANKTAPELCDNKEKQKETKKKKKKIIKKEKR